ncbi:Maf family protein [Marinomonas transparens]|uniref:7-methyl-GTP pyrophosphatase n=1 Tax=Marinomonas transparens TaxID=2795388 RepID=A0A934N387_9GAMM|nr:Maf family protein [Marinomonas transparens]MBJ7539467.1 septum formation inhibitor Maf [Marinomonas transparens]
MQKAPQKQLVLASSSPYRKSLLERLQIPFECHSPDIDESPFDGESAENLVKRLTISKAQAVQADKLTINDINKLIIASDQVAVLNQQILGKPLNNQNAIQQLKNFSGNKVSFLTGLCVLNQQTLNFQYELNQYHVYFRKLTIREIENYIRIEQPLDCAGSFKCEGLGISLFEKMEGEDPNSLIGLPLISLCRLLRQHQINPLG